MAGIRHNGPQCQVLQWFADPNDDGTTALTAHAAPGINLADRIAPFNLNLPDDFLTRRGLDMHPDHRSEFDLPPLGTDPKALDDDAKDGSEKKSKPDDDDPHLELQVDPGVNANAPRGTDPSTYTVSLVLKDWKLKTFGGDDSFAQLDLLSEPNVAVTVSPNPADNRAYLAAINVLNLHLHAFGHEIESSLAAQVQRTSDGDTSVAAQAQIEIHINAEMSVKFSSSVSAGPAGGPPDANSIPLGSGGNWSSTPFSVSAGWRF